MQLVAVSMYETVSSLYSGKKLRHFYFARSVKINFSNPIITTGARLAKTSDEENIVVLTNRISLLLSLLPLIYILSNVILNGWARITIPIILQPIFFLLLILF